MSRNNILRKIKYKNMPIFSKILLNYLFIIIFMTTIFLTSFVFYKNDKQNSTLKIVQRTNSQLLSKIESYVTDLYSITNAPLMGQSIETNIIDELKSFTKNNNSLYLQIYAEQMFRVFFNYKPEIHSNFLFNPDGKSVYKIKEGFLDSQYNPSDSTWFKDVFSNNGKPIIISTFELQNLLNSNKSPIYVFSVVRGLVDENNKTVGAIMVNTDVSFLEKLSSEMKITPSQRIIIMDDYGNVVFDTVRKNIAKKLPLNFLGENILDIKNIKELEVNKENVLVSTTRSESLNWNIVNIIPAHELFISINKAKRSFTIITITLLLISLLFTILTSRKIVKPIKRLKLLMSFVQDGNFEIKVNVDSNDEIGDLANSFNTMTDKIKILIDEVYVDKIKQKDLQLQLLQNQINPHFLYNTLESIHMMAEINHDKESSKMATALGRILRYGISNKASIVTIKDEIDNITDYITLQQVRFDELYSFKINIAEDIYYCKTIKLILQPLIENAINHGLSNKASEGLIEVLGYRFKSETILEVRDNGKGIDKQRLDRLNNYINDLDNSFTSIGLKNVNNRIKLHFGDNYGIHIYSEFNTGTTVKINMPYTLK